jgi:hypothetical protein
MLRENRKWRTHKGRVPMQGTGAELLVVVMKVL